MNIADFAPGNYTVDEIMSKLDIKFESKKIFGQYMRKLGYASHPKRINYKLQRIYTIGNLKHIALKQLYQLTKEKGNKYYLTNSEIFGKLRETDPELYDKWKKSHAPVTDASPKSVKRLRIPKSKNTKHSDIIDKYIKQLKIDIMGVRKGIKNRRNGGRLDDASRDLLKNAFANYLKANILSINPNITVNNIDINQSIVNTTISSLSQSYPEVKGLLIKPEFKDAAIDIAKKQLTAELSTAKPSKKPSAPKTPTTSEPTGPKAEKMKKDGFFWKDGKWSKKYEESVGSLNEIYTSKDYKLFFY